MDARSYCGKAKRNKTGRQGSTRSRARGTGEGRYVGRHGLKSLCRSLRDLANIAHEIEEAGAHLRVLEQNVDTTTSAGRAFFGMLVVFAQFETDVRRDRQAEGIATAMKAGVYTGGKPRIDR